MSQTEDQSSTFRSIGVSLWLRLIAIAIVALVFSETLILGSGRMQTWTYFATSPEIVFEATVRLVFATALAGIALGTVCTGIVTPFLWYFTAARERRVAEWAIKAAVVIALFLVSRLAINILIREDHWKPHYKPEAQAEVDKHHLGYDEFLATVDRAFGSFMEDLERSGKLHNTTVIVSADHSESFTVGVFQHPSAYQTRPVIHIPLMIRVPGRDPSRKVAFTADQTVLAPTILELAGQSRPNWMPGRSLVKLLNQDGQREGDGMAFRQYLEHNSRFRPLRHGTVGVIDGNYQYVLDLETNKGWLRPLDEAQIWDLDKSAEHPARAEALQAAIYSRFELKH